MVQHVSCRLHILRFYIVTYVIDQNPLKRAFNRALIFYAHVIRVCEASVLLK